MDCAEQQRRLCLRACALSILLREVRGRGSKALSCQVCILTAAFTPLVPYKRAELTAWLNGCPEEVRGLVTRCIPGACSPRALCGLVLGAWSC